MPPRGHQPRRGSNALAAVLVALGAATCTYNFDNFANGRDAAMGGGGSGGSLSTEAPGTGGNLTDTGGTSGPALGTGGSLLGTGGAGGAGSGLGSGLGGAAGSGRPLTGGQAGAGVGGAQTGGASSADAASVETGNACSGTGHAGVCWYLGSAGSTCQQVCASHGQPSTSAAAQVGSTKQGGSVARCGTLLRLLGISGTPTSATRTDGLGFGCHIFDDGTLWWLTSPDFKVTAGRSGVRLVCGCNE